MATPPEGAEATPPLPGPASKYGAWPRPLQLGPAPSPSPQEPPEGAGAEVPEGGGGSLRGSLMDGFGFGSNAKAFCGLRLDCPK